MALEPSPDRERDVSAVDDYLVRRIFEAYDLAAARAGVLRGVIQASIAQETSGNWPVLNPPLLLEADSPKAPFAIVRDLTPYFDSGGSVAHVGDDSLSAVVHAH